MLPFAITAVSVFFAILAIRARRLINSAIWLAGVSALLSVVFYLLGAHLVAVIELSVGAGLVTVLFAFAISVAGDETGDARPVMPKSLSIGLIVLLALVLAFYASQSGTTQSALLNDTLQHDLAKTLWQARGLDMLVQVVLLFSGVLGLLGLLAETRAPLDGSVAEEISARRDRDLQAMETQLSRTQEESR